MLPGKDTFSAGFSTGFGDFTGVETGGGREKSNLGRFVMGSCTSGNLTGTTISVSVFLISRIILVFILLECCFCGLTCSSSVRIVYSELFSTDVEVVATLRTCTVLSCSRDFNFILSKSGTVGTSSSLFEAALLSREYGVFLSAGDLDKSPIVRVTAGIFFASITGDVKCSSASKIRRAVLLRFTLDVDEVVSVFVGFISTEFFTATLLVSSRGKIIRQRLR